MKMNRENRNRNSQRALKERTEWLSAILSGCVGWDGKALNGRGNLNGPGRMRPEGKRKPWSGGRKCFPLKRRPFRTGTEVLSAQAATISDRDKSAFRSSGDHSGPGQKCFPPKRRPFQTGTEMLSAQAATISDPKSILSGTPGGLSTTDPSKTVTAQP